MQKWLQFWGPDPPSACPWCPDCLVSVGIGARLPSLIGRTQRVSGQVPRPRESPSLCSVVRKALFLQHRRYRNTSQNEPVNDRALTSLSHLFIGHF